MSSFELLASQEILSQVSNLEQNFDNDTNEELAVDSNPIPTVSGKSKKRPKDSIEDKKEVAPKIKSPFCKFDLKSEICK